MDREALVATFGVIRDQANCSEKEKVKWRKLKCQLANTQWRIEELRQWMEVTRCCCQCGEGGNGASSVGVGCSDGELTVVLVEDDHFVPSRMFRVRGQGSSQGWGL
jgi:hypothetical protein